ncbi:MAG: CGLAU_01105 family protein [Corynebacterium sp.]|nr:CGLAU_01105 family protein [Corynebacterium sp.]
MTTGNNTPFNADNADNAGNPSSTNDTLETLKAAGKSALDLAKDFTERFREDRETKSAAADSATASAHGFTGESPAGAKESGSFIDKATEIAKDLGGSVRRAAEGTRDSAEFGNAKENLGAAFAVAKEEATEAVKNLKGRVDEYKGKATTGNAQAPDTDTVADPSAAIVDGEVINDSEQTTRDTTS